MHASLQRNRFLLRDRVRILKGPHRYDVLDLDTQEVVLQCREERLGLLARLVRIASWEGATPFEIHVATVSGDPALGVRRGVQISLSDVEVRDEHGHVVGSIRQRQWRLGSRFYVLDEDGLVACTIEGSLLGWQYRLLQDGLEIGRVSKRWSGLWREFFTTADALALQIDAALVPPDDPIRMLMLASVLCIEMVLKRSF